MRVEEIFADICAEHAVWRVDTALLGAESARAFRAASLRRLGVIKKSERLLDLFSGKKTGGIVSNGQRVFSEQEMRMLGLYDRLGFVIFSSDLGYQKPDPRIYAAALGRIGLSAPRSPLHRGGQSRERRRCSPGGSGCRRCTSRRRGCATGGCKIGELTPPGGQDPGCICPQGCPKHFRREGGRPFEDHRSSQTPFFGTSFSGAELEHRRCEPRLSTGREREKP
ncbi:HAD family hydrolase [Methanoculleus chikugoensis]|uniref:HAD family hydrolase n=1 Tax=Methanoculleus chikugoensis TaxID=118126 RepID=UPI000A54FCE7|nr:HAD family hydrolase [Methanoculleus chikugoensis]